MADLLQLKVLFGFTVISYFIISTHVLASSSSFSAQEGQDALIYHKIKTKVQVNSNGACRWLSPYFSSTSCNIDSTHFPFDEQKCQVEIASWTATGNVVDVQLDTNHTIDTSQYLENIQWKMQSVSSYRQVRRVCFWGIFGGNE